MHSGTHLGELDGKVHRTLATAHEKYEKYKIKENIIIYFTECS